MYVGRWHSMYIGRWDFLIQVSIIPKAGNATNLNPRKINFSQSRHNQKQQLTSPPDGVAGRDAQ